MIYLLRSNYCGIPPQSSSEFVSSLFVLKDSQWGFSTILILSTRSCVHRLVCALAFSSSRPVVISFVHCGLLKGKNKVHRPQASKTHQEKAREEDRCTLIEGEAMVDTDDCLEKHFHRTLGSQASAAGGYDFARLAESRR